MQRAACPKRLVMERTGSGDGRPVCDEWLQGGEILAVGACVRRAGRRSCGSGGRAEEGVPSAWRTGICERHGCAPVVELGTADGRGQGM